MKIAESWLREWVNPDFDSNELAHQLTMLGHEVDGLAVEGEGIADVVIAEVLDVARHPNADRLSVCQVSDGGDAPIEVVCGAPNVRKGLKTPFARPGVKLPNGLKLRKAKIRGVVSSGMLCSATEIGLGDEADGIMELPAEAPTGTPLIDFLQLPDAVIDLDLTPNRGDCFSVLGIARDVAALSGSPLTEPSFAEPEATIDDKHPVELVLPEGCPRFAGRVVRGIDPNAQTPVWMLERLRRAGLRGIHPVVDITNFVMLELGQPLHAYDLALLNGPIRPRLATAGETLTLLDESEVTVNDNTLVISDDSGAIGLAGIMGGLSTAVSGKTVDVFFEGAFWPQAFMAGRARSYGMHTDASLRFERGVDPQGQARAVNRAVQLLLETAGGAAGPLDVQTAEEHLPQRPGIRLRRDRLHRLLGLNIADDLVTDILTRLNLTVSEVDEGWDVLAPSYRFDINLEVDLIEEIARIHGYDAIPDSTAIVAAPLGRSSESVLGLESVAATFVARDYFEAITYSFVDAASNRLLSGSDSELVLSNPISSEMSVMRSTLWPGLLAATAANLHRQAERVRLFEIGNSFHGSFESREEILRISGVAAGSALPEQWSGKSRSVDFFDIKSDVDAMLMSAAGDSEISYLPTEHTALQPGQACAVHRDGKKIGVLGKLHPRVAKAMDIKQAVFVFELDAIAAQVSAPAIATDVSKFPAIRRDIAVIVDDAVPAGELLRAAAAAAGKALKNVRIFDIYRGPGIEAGRKSIALGLILQETSRTLTDDDADAAMAAAVRELHDKFDAELRD